MRACVYSCVRIGVCARVVERKTNFQIKKMPGRECTERPTSHPVRVGRAHRQRVSRRRPGCFSTVKTQRRARKSKIWTSRNTCRFCNSPVNSFWHAYPFLKISFFWGCPTINECWSENRDKIISMGYNISIDAFMHSSYFFLTKHVIMQTKKKLTHKAPHRETEIKKMSYENNISIM